MTARASLRYGRLRPDEGALVAEDAEDVAPELDADQRAALHGSIGVSLQQAANGEMAPAARVLERLRTRRR